MQRGPMARFRHALRRPMTAQRDQDSAGSTIAVRIPFRRTVSSARHRHAGASCQVVSLRAIRLNSSHKRVLSISFRIREAGAQAISRYVHATRHPCFNPSPIVRSLPISSPYVTPSVSRPFDFSSALQQRYRKRVLFERAPPRSAAPPRR